MEKPPMTANEHFGQAIGQTLDRLPFYAQAWAKHRIQEVLFDAEFGQNLHGGIQQFDNPL